MEKLLQNLAGYLLPQEISLYFEIISIEEQSHGIELRMEEYSGLLPSALRESQATILDSFCNRLGLLHFSMKGNISPFLFPKIYYLCT
ncbi:MAG: hypothetical protein LBB53_04170 [Prevotellaceae bacterium]|jgi:hypothetical protein|nr:hypothetical protein [Prevotellaceae bacterium]